MEYGCPGAYQYIGTNASYDSPGRRDPFYHTRNKSHPCNPGIRSKKIVDVYHLGHGHSDGSASMSREFHPVVAAFPCAFRQFDAAFLLSGGLGNWASAISLGLQCI